MTTHWVVSNCYLVDPQCFMHKKEVTKVTF